MNRIRIAKQWLEFCSLFLATPARVLVIYLIGIGLAGLNPSHAQYGLSKWRVENGLPQNEILGIAQTKNGYLWISTMDGLARFDGVRFSIVDKSSTPGIVSNRLANLFESGDGDLWMSYEYGGLLRFHAGSFRSYGATQGIPATGANGITGDDAGNLWILNRGRIYKRDSLTDQFLPVSSLNVRGYGGLAWGSGWGAFDREHVYVFSRGVFYTYLLPMRLKGMRLGAIASDPDHVVWIETIRGERLRLRDDTVGRPHELPRAESMTVSGVNGQRWTMQLGPLLSRSVEGTIDGKPYRVRVANDLVDTQGNLWLGTGSEGLYRLKKSVIEVFGVAQGLPAPNVYPIFQDAADSVWVGTWRSGLSRLQGNRLSNYKVTDYFPMPAVTALFQDKGGRLWIGSHGPLRIFYSGKMQSVDFDLHDAVQAIYQDHEGDMWFGLREGLAHWSHGVVHMFTKDEGMPPANVHVITETRDGSLWVGTSRGLLRFRSGAFHRFSEQDGVTGDIWSLSEDRDGTLWIGTYDSGLIRLKDGKLTRYSTRDGLFNNGVFAIIDDEKGYLWISCDRGIYRVKKNELAEFAAGTRSSISSVAFDREDGLLDLECNGGIMPAGMRNRDGSIWFATQNGVAIVHPSDVQVSKPPPAIIEEVIVDQNPVSLSTSIVLPPSKDNLEIQYTAPSFEKPEQIRFRYRLYAFDKDWVEAGLRRDAIYTHIPPGKYRFLLSSQDGSGIWSAEGSGLAVTVLAPFYRRLWFESLVALIAISTAWVLWRRRLHRLKLEQGLKLLFLQRLIGSQEEERRRIAGELHDSLGQRLVVINAVAQLSLRSRRKLLESEEVDAFEEISTEALAAIEDTRTISYGLRPIHLDRFGMTKAIELLIKNISTASSVRMTAELDDIDDVISEDQTINLYRIVQEALSNVVKYALASLVEVRIQRLAEHMLLSIEDDGVGFETVANVNKTGRRGLGLHGMSERASLLGGEFSVISAPGQGTKLHIKIPKHGK